MGYKTKASRELWIAEYDRLVAELQNTRTELEQREIAYAVQIDTLHKAHHDDDEKAHALCCEIALKLGQEQAKNKVLEAEWAKAREDSARLDYLEEIANAPPIYNPFSEKWRINLNEPPEYSTLREAIDAVRKESNA